MIDIIKDMLTSLTLRRNAIAPEMDVTLIITLTYLATGKMQLCNSDDLGLYLTALSELYCSFPIKYVKYDRMVNKKSIIYIHMKSSFPKRDKCQIKKK